MVTTRPAKDEFEISDRGVTHLPTGARWNAYVGSAELHSYERGRLGGLLPDGRDYRGDLVKEMALQLWRSSP
jgi:hypothetical protein